MLNFYQISRNTFRECLREPIYFILLASALTLIGLFPSMSLFVFREQIKLVIDSAMATTLVFGLIAAVLCASHTVSREMRNGTVLLLMSKPVHRWTFIIAKIAGIGLALCIFVFICNCATMTSLKIARDQFQLNFALMYIYFGIIVLAVVFGGFRNFSAHASFSSNTVMALLILIPLLTVTYFLLPESPHGAEDEHGGYLRVIPALILIFHSVCAMGVITVAISTRLDMVPNLTISAMIFFMGLLSGYFLSFDSGNTFINFATGLLYAILPNWQFFWLADALAANRPIPMSYMLWATVYVILYILLCSLWALALFQNREMAKDAQN